MRDYNSSPVILSAANERALIRDVLQRLGAGIPSAECVAHVLTEADLRGYASHGLAGLREQVGFIRGGSVRADAEPTIESEQAAALRINGQLAPGPYAVTVGIRAGVRHAVQYGSCAVGLHNHGYTAYNGAYPELGLADGCICLFFGKAARGAHPYGGFQPILGTNPISVALPTDGDPLLIDLATSTVSTGKLSVAARAGESIPLGWAVDENGVPTSDPEAGRRGAVTPLGGAKGFALSLAFGELLAGILSGMPPGFEVKLPDGTWRPWTSFAIVVYIPAFMELGEFRRRASEHLLRIKQSPVAPGFVEILLPGERAYRTRRQRLVEGIPHSETIWNSTTSLAAEVGIDAASYTSPTRTARE
jgi:L-2-hydroxycarboxylate dehydrogenase (NAD+)